MGNIYNHMLFFRLSFQYLHLVEVIINEILNKGNRQVVITNHYISEDEFYEKTKWSDFVLYDTMMH